MSDSSDSLVFNLSKPSSPAVFAALRAAVERAVEDRVESIVIDLDGLAVLDGTAIAELVSLLRAVRERGATMSLRATRSTIIDTLSVTALDKIFTIVSTSERPPLAEKKRVRYVASIALAALLSVFVPAGAHAAEPWNASALIHDVVVQSENVASYKARVNVDFKLRSFPYVSQHLVGTTYYKRPDNFEIVFDNVPSYAKGFDKLYSDIDDPASWERRFALSIVGTKRVDGHDDLVLRLVQKVRGMIDHEDVAIDPARAHIDAMEWYYYNGGTIAMTQEFKKVGNFDVLSSQHATIRIPFVHAAADAAYTGYETGVAIDDAVFTRGEAK